jgi:hypothetical protein
MHFTDILNFGVSVLDLHGLICCLSFLIPRNVLPHVSSVLSDAEQLLYRAESTGGIPQSNDYRSTLAMYDGAIHTSMNELTLHD